jgi:hypothetical protein
MYSNIFFTILDSQTALIFIYSDSKLAIAKRVPRYQTPKGKQLFFIYDSSTTVLFIAFKGVEPRPLVLRPFIRV